MMKKMMCLLLVCLFSVGLLTACATGGSTGATNDAAKVIIPALNLKNGDTTTSFTLIATGPDTAFSGCGELETVTAGTGVDAMYAILAAMNSETKIAMTEDAKAYSFVWTDADKKEHTDFKFTKVTVDSEKAAVLAVANKEAKYALVSTEKAAELVKEVNAEKNT